MARPTEVSRPAKHDKRPSLSFVPCMVAVALSSAGVGDAGTAVAATRVKPHGRQLGLLQVPV